MFGFFVYRKWLISSGWPAAELSGTFDSLGFSGLIYSEFYFDVSRV